MPSYRHCTNLRKPFDKVDQAFLDDLADWKEGPPVPVKPKPGLSFVPKTFAELVDGGVVGIYTTAESLAKPSVKKRTAWDKPMLILGQELPSDALHA